MWKKRKRHLRRHLIKRTSDCSQSQGEGKALEGRKASINSLAPPQKKEKTNPLHFKSSKKLIMFLINVKERGSAGEWQGGSRKERKRS